MTRHLSQHEHLSEEDFLLEIYGAGSGEAHLCECAECSARMRALLRSKARVQAEADSRPLASAAFFAAQRRSIYARLDRAAASHIPWAPALACAALLAVGLLLFPHTPAGAPHPPLPAERVELSDNEQLFSDLYSMEQSVEPSVDVPIQELFQEPAPDGQ